MSAPALAQEQAAELAGLTVRHLRRLDKEDNPPPRTASGTYPCTEFGAWLRQRALRGVSIGDDGTVYNYEAERARLTHEQADKTALENAELRGDLARMSVVEQWWSELGAAMRGKLVAIPSRLAALIADVPLRARFTTQAEALMFEALAEIQKDAVPAAIRARIGRARRDDVPVVAAAAAETDG